MAEPAWKTPTGEPWAPDREVSEDTEERSVLQRWIETPERRLELLELPLTPELFLDPQLDDIMSQGEWHATTALEISVLLRSYFRSQPDVRVFHELKHRLGRGLPAPSPDVSVVRGLRDPTPLDSLDVEKEGVRPSLVIEVVSPLSARVRQTDLEGKVQLYQRVGIPEYLIVDATRRRGERRYSLLGYRLDARGRYQPIQPDAEGGLLSETTGIRFQIGPTGDRVLLFEAATGRRLLNLDEQEEKAQAAEERAIREAKRALREEEARRAAEEKALREAEARRAAEDKAVREEDARKAAESEVVRLRAEIERLRQGSD
jgi:Uma2 family endonuclease